MIIGLVGRSFDSAGNKSNMGSGKDVVADILMAERNFAKVALADPMKRFCRELFGFTDEQLWGASEKRNEPDARFGRKPQGDFLTPRMALQLLGTEWGRYCYEDVWVEYMLRQARQLLGDPDIAYSGSDGIHPRLHRDLFYVSEHSPECSGPYEGVAVSDVRFPNEAMAIRRAGGEVWLVLRPRERVVPTTHVSENSLDGWDVDQFDGVIMNNSDLDKLRERVIGACDNLFGKERPYV